MMTLHVKPATIYLTEATMKKTMTALELSELLDTLKVNGELSHELTDDLAAQLAKFGPYYVYALEQLLVKLNDKQPKIVLIK